MKARLIKLLIAMHIVAVVLCVYVGNQRSSPFPQMAAGWLSVFAIFLYSQVLPAAKQHDELDRRHALWRSQIER